MCFDGLFVCTIGYVHIACKAKIVFVYELKAKLTFVIVSWML